VRALLVVVGHEFPQVRARHGVRCG
jgi:hypothetical protein